MLLASVALSLGCTQKKITPSNPPVGLAGAQTAANGTALSQKMSGIAQEVLSQQGVSYVLLKEKNTKKAVWIALIESSVKKGEFLTVDAEVEMKDFYSKSLNKKFEQVVFAKKSLETENK